MLQRNLAGCWRLALALMLIVDPKLAPAAEERYWPGAGAQWEQRAAQSAGMDAEALEAAVKFAQSHEIAWSRDVRAEIEKDVAGEPFPEILGETRERGGSAGVIVRHGYVIANWGDVQRADMSFSVAKSYLSTLAGLALERKLIKDIRDPVWKYIHDGTFDTAHNSKITWHMLLNQTSEWEGKIWGKPDAADRREGYGRKLQTPGTLWEYNDVRVNRLALALMQVWNRSLSDVLKEQVMDPIGASDTWVWLGYRNSYVALNGRAVQSVSGGSHWGGGLWASTMDHARFGLLFLRKGQWKGRQVVPEQWISMATTPTDIAPHYGYMWWLNTGRALVPSAPAASFFALGSGGNVIWIDPAHDLVVVARWLDFGALDEFAKRIVGAVKQ